MQKFDVLIIGGGISGSTAAAAMASKGMRVLVCEAGLPNGKRLAGELMHPPAAARLEDLGLLEPLREAGGVPVYGFAVFQDAQDQGTVLSYSEVRGCRPMSLAIDHAVLTRKLLETVEARPGVTVWKQARVMGVDFDGPLPRASIRIDDELCDVEASLVVSAEGRESKIREKSGIACERGAPFRMVGWKIPGARLPYPGYGHVFIGGPSATLAYQVSRDDVRIMFETDLSNGKAVPEALLTALPEPFQSDVRAAISEQPAQSARVYGLTPTHYAASKLAIVGDAGGCVHPITASGIAYCTSDAVDLADCLGRHDRSSDGIDKALKRYDALRTGPMRSRVALGPALVDAFTGESPEEKLLRYGLFRYWRRSSRGRARSMSLLATHDQSMRRMSAEYASVVAHSVTGIPRGVVPVMQVPQALAGLVKRTAQLAWAEVPALIQRSR